MKVCNQSLFSSKYFELITAYHFAIFLGFFLVVSAMFSNIITSSYFSERIDLWLVSINATSNFLASFIFLLSLYYSSVGSLFCS
ncbi:unnamed protein product [Moneuplotes crassus]|uniref:Uncharacterized protein n=1 Tax=Euplotes crassus TaxID=5936 RepID=A0AAD1XQN7_EUPCR|nr:unnamed protein product [Moneuplotes crassus]